MGLDTRVLAALGLLLALVLGVGWFARSERAAGAAACRAEVAKAATQAAEQRRREEQRRSDALAEVSRVARLDAARKDADRRAVDDAAARLLQRARDRAASQGAATAAGSAAAADSAGVPVDVFSSVVAAARRLAAIADERGTAGQACEHAYDALTP